MKTAIIGAGIGGLTTALALKQNGQQAIIYEGVPEIKPVGAGIILANNAMQVFKKLGLQEKIEKAGNKISCMKITDPQLNNISVVDLSAYEKKYSVQNVAIHRGELQKILANEVGYNNINLSKRLLKIEKSELFKLTFEDNSTTESNIVIGADGIKSVVRNQLFEENKLRNANQKCWRGICEMDLPQKYDQELNEAWGKGKRFGFVKIGKQKLYWYALADSKNIKQDEVDLGAMFSEFHSDILKIISAADKEQVIINDILDLKPIYKWQSENVCLIGDAAHATTPNIGQGACQAIEDAFVLSECLHKYGITKAFSEYQKLRLPKAHRIVKTSWIIGNMAHLQNPVFIGLRNQILRLMPSSVNRRQNEQLFQLAKI